MPFTEAKRAAAINNHGVERVSRVAFADPGAANPRHSHAHCKVVRQPIGENCRGALDGFEIVNALIAGNCSAGECLIAQGPQAYVLEHNTDGSPDADRLLCESCTGKALTLDYAQALGENSLFK